MRSLRDPNPTMDLAITSQGSTMLKPGLPGCRTLNSEASWLSSPLVVSPLLRAASMLPLARANRAAAGMVRVSQLACRCP